MLSVYHHQETLKLRTTLMALTQTIQFSMDLSMAVVYYDGRITTNATGVLFESDAPIFFRMKSTVTIDELKRDLQRKVGDGSRQVAEINYRCPSLQDGGSVYYTNMTLVDDDDIQIIWNGFGVYASNGPIELFVKFVRSTDEIIACLHAPENTGV